MRFPSSQQVEATDLIKGKFLCVVLWALDLFSMSKSSYTITNGVILTREYVLTQSFARPVTRNHQHFLIFAHQNSQTKQRPFYFKREYTRH